MKRKYIYGPVPSRRLGISLGVDLVPYKTCSFNCIYCQLGNTTKKTIVRKEYLPAEKILKDLKFFIKSHPRIDYITISGSGEPTLNSKIGYIIKEIKKISEIPVAVITNGALFFMEDVRNDLMSANVVLPTLCTAVEKTFKNIHRPHPDLQIKNIIKGLIELRAQYKGKIYLEVMLIKNFNDSIEEIEKLKMVFKKINFDKIQLNTPVRPPSEDYAIALSQKELMAIKKILGRGCEIIVPFKKGERKLSLKDNAEVILNLIKRRPVAVSDITSVLKLNPNLVIKLLTYLEEKKKIKRIVHNKKDYYVEFRNILS